MIRLENGFALKIGTQKAFVHLQVDPSRTMIKGLISNPNRFKHWGAYLTFLESILPSEVLQSSVITRIDLNIDFNMPFSQLIQQIDVKKKSTSVLYEDKAGDKTGIYIGKGSEVLVIYDKEKKEKLSSSHSRIELRLSGTRLPTKSLYKLPRYLSDLEYFSKIEGQLVQLKASNLNELQSQKAQDFQSILRREGLFAARKAMSKNRNFERDFAQLLQTCPWGLPPSEIFKNGIQAFLSPNTAESKGLKEILH